MDAAREPGQRLDSIRSLTVAGARDLEPCLDRMVVSHPDRAAHRLACRQSAVLRAPSINEALGIEVCVRRAHLDGTPRGNLPIEFRSKVPGLAQAYQGIGLLILVYGLVVFDVVAVVSGVLITQGGKLWCLDRMVLIYEAMKQRDEAFASWEY